MSIVKLTIDNSTCHLQGLDTRQYSQIKELMSYQVTDQQRFFTGHMGSGKRSLITKRGEFPTGLLYIALDWLKANKVPYSKNDTRRVPMPLESTKHFLLPYPLYDDQINAVQACIDGHRGIVSATTGSGKSIMIALLIQSLKVRTLVVVPSLELKRQLSESLAEVFGAEYVGPNLRIWVENVDALDPTVVVKDYDCVIIDEFHHSGAKTYRNLNKKAWGKIYYRFGFTATPFRSQDNERLLLESVLSKVVYKLSYVNAVERGYVVAMSSVYLNTTTMPTDCSSYPDAYKNLIVENKTRNHQIHELLVKLHANNLSTLCLVKEIRHGEILEALTGLPFVSGQNGERYLMQKFATGGVKTLIATTGVMGEGVDSKACEYVVIATPVKSKNLFMQMVGRALRKFPGKESATVILLRDTSHKWFRTAFNEQKKILKEEYGVIPAELVI